MAAWESDAKFMLNEYLMWLPEPAHSILKNEWPPVAKNEWKKSMIIQCKKLVQSPCFKRVMRSACED